MAKSRHKPSSLFPRTKRKAGRPETPDKLLIRVEYLYPRVHGFISPKKAKVKLLPFEVAEIAPAVNAIPREPLEPASRWAARVVADMVSQEIIKGTYSAYVYSSCGSINGGRIRNMLKEIKTRKSRPNARWTNDLELGSEWIWNGEVEVPVDPDQFIAN